jgi:hypothetical protein
MLQLVFERVWLDEGCIVAVRPKRVFAPYFQQRTRKSAARARCKERERTGLKPAISGMTAGVLAVQRDTPDGTTAASAQAVHVCVTPADSSCKRFASIRLPRRCHRVPPKCTVAAENWPGAGVSADYGGIRVHNRGGS